MLISIGIETYCNVWAPETLITQKPIGRLEGHSAAIVDGHFLKRAPFFVSVDTKEIIKFWDLTNFQCIQTLHFQFQNEVLGLLPLFNRKFWIYSQRFYQFDTLGTVAVQDDVESSDNQMNDQKVKANTNFPGDNENEKAAGVYCCLNSYHLNFFLVKPKEIRVYNT